MKLNKLFIFLFLAFTLLLSVNSVNATSVDYDEDGVENWYPDNCLFHDNILQENQDGDSLGDPCDPNMAEPGITRIVKSADEIYPGELFTMEVYIDVSANIPGLDKPENAIKRVPVDLTGDGETVYGLEIEAIDAPEGFEQVGDLELRPATIGNGYFVATFQWTPREEHVGLRYQIDFLLRDGDYHALPGENSIHARTNIHTNERPQDHDNVFEVIVYDHIGSTVSVVEEPDTETPTDDNKLPTAVCTPFPTSIHTGEMVRLSAAGSSDVEDSESELEYLWDLDEEYSNDIADYNEAAGREINLRITEEGSHHFRVMVVDQDGGSDIALCTVRVTNGNPDAPMVTVSDSFYGERFDDGRPGQDFRICTSTTSRPNAITLTAFSDDPDGDEITHYRWELDEDNDGSFDDSVFETEDNMLNYFSRVSGTQRMRVYAIDEFGDVSPRSEILYLHFEVCNDPVASCQAYESRTSRIPKTTAAIGSVVYMDGRESNSPDGRDLSFNWNLGRATLEDTNGDDEIFVSFSEVGRQSVDLRVTDSYGLSDLATCSIDVVDDDTPGEGGPDDEGLEPPTVPVFELVNIDGDLNACIDGPIPVIYAHSTDPDGDDENIRYRWFIDTDGDGIFDETRESMFITLPFTEVGDYKVAVRAIDERHIVSEGDAEIVISFIDCSSTGSDFEVDLRAEPTEGDVPLNVLFEAVVTGESSSADLTYEWDFGNGESATTSTNTIDFTYTEDGEYTAVVVVTDLATGETTSDNIIIIVHDGSTGPGELKVELEAAPLRGRMPLTVSFDAIVGGAEGEVSYLWDFGTGDTVTTLIGSIDAVFDTPGIYTVTVTVTDSRGETGSDSIKIRVLPKNPNGPGGPGGPGGDDDGDVIDQRARSNLHWSDFKVNEIHGVLPGSNVNILLDLRNEGFDIDKMNGFLSVPELGIAHKFGMSSLEENENDGLVVSLPIPANAQPGEYVVRADIVAFSEGIGQIHRIKYRTIKVVSE